MAVTIREIFRTSVGNRWMVCAQVEGTGPMSPDQFGMTDIDVVVGDNSPSYDRQERQYSAAGDGRILVYGA